MYVYSVTSANDHLYIKTIWLSSTGGEYTGIY